MKKQRVTKFVLIFTFLISVMIGVESASADHDPDVDNEYAAPDFRSGTRIIGL